ncbi:MAG: nucleoside hydrolase [Burkholderiaceae bacterium]|nr:nucleoside hydrolase [Burkholderiaceae bacterium]MBT9502061.1 nucleoside hydrolase [Burkholderiaceae bacterium]
MSTKHTMIIDTDPGVDDALALMLAAYSPEIELLGLTTIFGNVSVEQATKNAGFLVSLMPKAVPVAQGAATPLVNDLHPYPDFVHGKNGFGDIDVAYPADFTPDPRSAAQFIVDQINARPGEVTLVPVGPLTNIALALHLDPSIKTKVKQVVIMGGAVYRGGNVSPAAEANIWNDVHAAQVVFAADWPIVMVGLDVTHQTVMPETRMNALCANSPKVGGFLAKICEFYANFYRNTAGFDGFCVHDPATVVQVLRPDLFGTERGQIEVVTEGLALGKTLFGPAGFMYAEPGWGKRTNVEVCTTVDSEGVLKFIEDVIRTAP